MIHIAQPEKHADFRHHSNANERRPGDEYRQSIAGELTATHNPGMFLMMEYWY